jgi:hypothetical protein
MKKGHNPGRRVDFNRFVSSCFTPNLYTSPLRRKIGCGATALGLLTGIPTEKIATKKRGDHYSDNFMLRFLRRHGFRTLELTSSNVSPDRSKIGDTHVLLLSQYWSSRLNEATWIVLHDQICYHNFDLYSLESLSFLRKPLLSAFLIHHPRWGRPTKKREIPPGKPPSRKPRFTFAKLGLIPSLP